MRTEGVVSVLVVVHVAVAAAVVAAAVAGDVASNLYLCCTHSVPLALTRWHL